MISIRAALGSEALGSLDSRLFGQFLEKHPEETGPEPALLKDGETVAPKVLELLKTLHIPLIRFPGGYVVDFLDWTDSIDNAPGRGARPAQSPLTGKPGSVTNRFGYEEFFALCRTLGSQPLLTLDFGSGVLGHQSPEEAAMHAAGLVAYCNSEVGARLPSGMPDWPSIRRQNGREQPHGVPLFQIGNETWFFLETLRKRGLSAAQARDRYLECLKLHVDRILAVDPSVELIIDGQCALFGHAPDLLEAIHESLGEAIQYLSYHRYKPWGIRDVTDATGRSVPISGISEEAAWKAWVSAPECDPRDGMSRFPSDPVLGEAGRFGYRVAATEWNFNGWWEETPIEPINSMLARTIGAAGFLHALIRDAASIRMACQSMLMGHLWKIAGVYMPDKDVSKAYVHGTAQVTALYSRVHGNELMPLEIEELPTYGQPLRMGWLSPQEKVAWADLVCTRRGNRLYLHGINRNRDEDYSLRLDMSALGSGTAKPARMYLLSGDPKQRSGGFPIQELKGIGDCGPGRIAYTLPKASVSILEIELPST